MVLNIRKIMGYRDTIGDEALALNIIDIETETAHVFEPAKKLAVEHAHGVINRALETHRAEEARLLHEINVRLEELRQVRVTLDALNSAFAILDEDKRVPALAPPIT